MDACRQCGGRLYGGDNYVCTCKARVCNNCLFDHDSCAVCGWSFLDLQGPTISAILALPAGAEHWKEYQELGIAAISELFVPPLGRPIVELTTRDGLDRRDAVFPNHATEGFWATMMSRYDADVVVFDAKNLTGSPGKEEVGQIRNYLLRHDSVGRFGIILARKSGSSGALDERQEALHSDHAMILLLTDKDLGRMYRLKGVNLDPAVLLDRQRMIVQLRG